MRSPHHFLSLTTAFVGLASSLVLLPSCGEKQKQSSAQKELESSGYQATEADFFRAIENGDTRALDLYAKQGMDLTAKDANGWTALHTAARTGRQESAAFLLENNIPIDVLGHDNITPLMLAAREGQASMVRYLIKQGAKPELKDTHQRTALILAVDGSHNNCIEELAAYSRNQLDTALLYAAAEGKHKTIDSLTAFGASVYARHDGRMTPLMLAAQRGDAKTTQALLDSGANLYAVNEHGWTASQVAAAAGHTDLANALGQEPTDTALAINAPTSDAAVWNEPQITAEAPAPAPATDATTPSPNSPAVPTQKKLVRKKTTVPTLSNKSLPSAATTPKALAKEVSMRYYQESPLPLMVEKTSLSNSGKPTAQMRTLYGKQKPVQVAEGETIPGTRFRITRIKRMLNHSKVTDGQPADISQVIIKDTQTGQTRTMTARIPATAAAPWAVLHHNTSGKNYAARAGDTFTSESGETYRILDVRPTQIIIAHPQTGETSTVPMGR